MSRNINGHPARHHLDVFFALFRSARWGTDMHGAKSSRGNEGEKSKGTDHHQAVRISGYGSIPIDTFLVV